MAAKMMSDGFGDLVENLRQLEDFFPLLGAVDDHAEFDDADLEDDIRDLEQLVAVAGEPRDEHSQRALAYLQTELARKRARLDGF
jgi:hypothetical protein